MTTRLITLLIVTLLAPALSQHAPLRAQTGSDTETSVAGFFPLEGAGRQVYNFNQGWRFFLGDAEGAAEKDFDDSSWTIVNTPHSVQLMPAEASGCRNYQGKAWYRKHFALPKETAGKNLSLHFEAIMGKQEIYVDGVLAKKHEGGYLPVTIDLTALGLTTEGEHVVSVMADNSDDKTFPPGKTQLTLDFAYHGGIYRDVWLIAKSKVAMTDALEQGEVAGGALFVHYENLSAKEATVVLHTQVKNSSERPAKVSVEQTIDGVGRQLSKAVTIAAGATHTFIQRMKVKNPHLWTPDTPTLYILRTRVRADGAVADGGITRLGLRSIEAVATDDSKGRKPGFYLNGERYRQLVGANRHQDFAYVGNALPNSQQWRDAKRLRDAGFTIIRTAHYPQDPAFMDACDELGLMVIVATPGWQFWNKMEGWDEKVHQNTRLIIRRDRNHPSVVMWEPILNETRYPEEFALKALQITREEYPFESRPMAAADVHSAGVAENYDVVYGWPGDDFKDNAPRQPIFTREFGEYVDDWYAHNNLNRASRSWGEQPMLTQALSLAKTTAELYQTTGQFIGGCQWHPFDHQRGYHPDPYWGGIYDAFRQKKTAFAMFQAALWPAEVKPVVSIAHEMTQFSNNDVTVFTNCDSIRLTIYDGEKQLTKPVFHGSVYGSSTEGIAPSMPVVFENAWDFWEARNWSYTNKQWQKVKMVAEGIVDGKVVCREEKMPSRRSTKLRLVVDDLGKPLVADGSDFVVVVCEVTDDLGHTRRLAKEQVVFTVEGEGEIIGDASINANPRAVEWGSAPALIRSTATPGKIKIRAEVQFPGTHAPTPAEIELESVAAKLPAVAGKVAQNEAKAVTTTTTNSQQAKLSEEEKQQLLLEVEQQQAEFGIQQ